MLLIKKLNVLMFYMSFYIIFPISILGILIGFLLAFPFLCISFVCQKVTQYLNPEEQTCNFASMLEEIVKLKY